MSKFDTEETNKHRQAIQVLSHYLLTVYSLLTVGMYKYVKDRKPKMQNMFRFGSAMRRICSLDMNLEVFALLSCHFMSFSLSSIHYTCHAVLSPLCHINSHLPAAKLRGWTCLHEKHSLQHSNPFSHQFLPNFLRADNIWSRYNNLSLH